MKKYNFTSKREKKRREQRLVAGDTNRYLELYGNKPA